jgi:hypothetical protein
VQSICTRLAPGLTGIALKKQGRNMNTAGPRLYPDSTRLGELVQKIRMTRSDLSAMIEQSHHSKVISRLIMASGLLDGALEELSKAASEQSG